MTILEATVMDGELKLDLPRPLPDRCRVRVTVAPLDAAAADEWAAFIQRSRETPIHPGNPRFTGTSCMNAIDTNIFRRPDNLQFVCR